MTNKKILSGAIAVILIGVAFIYYTKYRSGEKPTDKHSINDSISTSNHEVSPSNMGAKPKRNPEDGSIQIVEDFIKANSTNPNTFEFLEWSEVLIEDGYWKVRCKYRGIS